jgi:hypothetical protein
VLHEQVVGSSEHQIRLSKGVTAKFVLRKELGTGKAGSPGKSGRLDAVRGTKKATAEVAFWELGCGCFLSLFPA